MFFAFCVVLFFDEVQGLCNRRIWLGTESGDLGSDIELRPSKLWEPFSCHNISGECGSHFATNARLENCPVWKTVQRLRATFQKVLQLETKIRIVLCSALKKNQSTAPFL